MGKTVFVNAFEYGYLGTRLLAAYLQRLGHETHNILLGSNGKVATDTQNLLTESYEGYQQLRQGKIVVHANMARPLTEKDLLSLESVLREETPDIIGFSARPTNNYLVPILVPIFRRAAPGALLAAGGFGPTLEPEIYLDGGFDVVVRGDGEEPMRELAICKDAGDMEAARCIANTYWSEKWGKARNNLRDQEKELSKYPPMLWGDAFFTVIANGRIRRYYDPLAHGKSYITYFGRGCTGRCSYCSGGQWISLYRDEGRKAYPRRNRNILDVVRECEKCPESTRMIMFSDEYWALPTAKTQEFFTLYKEKVGKPFSAYLGYEQMVNNKELFELVVDAGLQYTGIGFQTGSARLSRQCYQRELHADILVEYAHMLFTNYIHCCSQFIGGNCYETIEDFNETINLVRRLPFSMELPYLCDVEVIRLRPHPKTPITIIAPRVVSDPMPAREWLFRALILNFARFSDENTLIKLMDNKKFIEDPFLLKDLYIATLMDLQRKHFEKLREEGAGKDWIFYGAGKQFSLSGSFFNALKPRAIMVDREFSPEQKMLHNIPVVYTEDIMRDMDRETRFLVFALPSFPLAKKLLRGYGVSRSNIHCCELNLS